MNEQAYYPRFQEYASGARIYQIPTSARDENSLISSQEPKKQTKQPGYSLKNLPIIYTNDSKIGTPSKQSGSSRIVYQQKSKVEKYQLSSGRHSQQNFLPYQAKIQEQTNAFKQWEAQLDRGTPSSVRPINYEVENTNSRLQFESNSLPSYLGSKIVTLRQPASQIGCHPTNFPASITQVNPTNLYLNPQGLGSMNGNLPQNIVHQSPKNITSVIHENRVKQVNIEPLVSSHPPLHPQSIPQKLVTSGVSHLSLETVPKIHFDRCVNECKNWETKYNQLYLKYMNLATAANEPRDQVEQLKQENWRLKQQLKQKEDGRAAWMSMAQEKFAMMVNSQQEATIRECMLLMERFRLEARQSKF